MSLGMEICLGPGDFVLDGTPLPLLKREGGGIFDNVCGQTAGWMKMTFDTDVGLTPGDFTFLPISKRMLIKYREKQENFHNQRHSLSVEYVTITVKCYAIITPSGVTV